jgi:hypothetical protein
MCVDILAPPRPDTIVGAIFPRQLLFVALLSRVAPVGRRWPQGRYGVIAHVIGYSVSSLWPFPFKRISLRFR